MFLAVKNLGKVYGSGKMLFKALNKVNLTIKKGEIVVILGPSGSGKSTLLNIIGGIDRADEGEVWLKDTNIKALTDDKLTIYRREKVGFVFQFYNLISNLTVSENIEVAANISKNPMSMDKIMEAVGVLELKDRFPRELSGGQQQRVAIARALIKNPEILFCDEPTGALDFATSKEILKLIEDVNKQFQTTILIITHNNAIAGISHRIIRLRSGEIVENKVNSNVISAERIEW